MRYETTTILNSAYRIIKTKIKSFDETGTLAQNDIQEFKLDKRQRIEYYKTTHRNYGASERTTYKYLATDKLDNPTKLLMIRKERDAKTLVTIDYLYFN